MVILSTLLAFALLGFMLSRSIKKFEKNKAAQKKKKGRSKFISQSKTPGSR
jgi:hypothetical protein